MKAVCHSLTCLALNEPAGQACRLTSHSQVDGPATMFHWFGNWMACFGSIAIQLAPPNHPSASASFACILRGLCAAVMVGRTLKAAKMGRHQDRPHQHQYHRLTWHIKLLGHESASKLDLLFCLTAVKLLQPHPQYWSAPQATPCKPAVTIVGSQAQLLRRFPGDMT